jgi:dihydroorotate dehydrogenase electron transfer subunit
MKKLIKAKILRNTRLQDSIYRIDFESEDIAQNAIPGQFVNIKCGDSIMPLLRRPISICDIDKINKSVAIVFQTKASGTGILSTQKKGEYLDIIGPVGTPFYLSEEYKNILVVGGGIGVFPLLHLLKESKANFKSAILGFRSKDFVVMEEEFKKFVSTKGENKGENDASLRVLTDDGSYGDKGLVIDGLSEYIVRNNIDIIYACGPNLMLKSVSEIAKAANVPCQVSMEQRMGCGIGACLVCACKVKAQAEDDFSYKRVCKDGPVFWSDEVIFD